MAKVGLISGELGVRTGVRRVQSGGSMKPEQMIDCGCECGRWDMKFSMAMCTKDIGTFAAVARSSMEGVDLGNKAKGGVEVCTGVKADASMTTGVSCVMSLWQTI